MRAIELASVCVAATLFLPKCSMALVRHPVSTEFLTGSLHSRHSLNFSLFLFHFVSFSTFSLCLIPIRS